MFIAFGIELQSTVSWKIFDSWFEPSLVDGGFTNWNVTFISLESEESIPKATTNAKFSIFKAL